MKSCNDDLKNFVVIINNDEANFGRYYLVTNDELFNESNQIVDCKLCNDDHLLLHSLSITTKLLVVNDLLKITCDWVLDHNDELLISQWPNSS